MSMTYGAMNYRPWLGISIKLLHLIQQGTRVLYLHLLLKMDLMQTCTLIFSILPTFSPAWLRLEVIVGASSMMALKVFFFIHIFL